MATNPILDIPIRQRQSTNVPMPFELMYQMLNEKQKRYDAAEAIDRENKKDVSKLSSPISGHNQYLSQLKANYLKQMMDLHNNMPDKASSEYKRKSESIVDAVVMDPNYNLIQESNASWLERTKIVSQLMAQGKYSPAADRVYQNFNGVNPDGTLKKFEFAGLRPKVDLQEIYARAYALTPEEKGFKTFPKGNTVVTLQESGKKPEKLKQSYLSLLGNDGVEDYMYENNIKSPEEFEQHLNAQVLSNSDYKVSTKIDPNYEGFYAGLAAQKHQLDKQKHALDVNEQALRMLKLKKEILQGEEGGENPATSQMQFQNANVPSDVFDENIASQIKPDGSITAFEEGLWRKVLGKSLKTYFPGAANKLGVSQPTGAEGSLQSLLNEQRRNIEVANRMNPGPAKLNENMVRLRYKNSKKTNLNVHKFNSADDRNNASKDFWENYNGYQYQIVDGENAINLTPEQSSSIVETLGSKKSGVQAFVQGKLNAFNVYGPVGYSVKIVGEVPGINAKNPSLVAYRTPAGNDINSKLAIQEHLLAKAYTKGVPQSFPDGYIDPYTREYLRDPNGKKVNGVEVFWKHFNDAQSSRHIVAYD
jgi:hypothetical protein